MSHKEKLLQILKDGKAHSNFEIHEKTGMLRYSARIWDLKKEGFEIESWDDQEDPQKHWFKLKAGVGCYPAVSSANVGTVKIASSASPQLLMFEIKPIGHW